MVKSRIVRLAKRVARTGNQGINIFLLEMLVKWDRLDDVPQVTV
jgi:hypothetical protein